MPLVGLPLFAAKFPRIDIILNLNARTYRMQRGDGQAVMPPRDVLASLHKRHWLVRRTRFGSGNDWLLSIGRNVETGEHRAMGFHKLDSPMGRDTMMRVEGQRQGDLAV